MPVLTPLPLQRHSTAYSPQTHYQYLASESTSFLSACDHAMERRKGGAGARRSSSANPWAAPPATSTPSETRKPKATTAGGSTPHRPGGAASRRPVDALEECLAAANTAGFDAPSVTSREGGAAEVATAYVRAKRELADAKVDAAVRERNAMHKEFLSADVARLKADKLAHSAVTLENLVKHKDLLLQRLQQPCSGSTICVESSGQADLVALLRHAAADSAMLDSAPADLGQLEAFAKPHSYWADSLRPLLDAGKEMQRYRDQLEETREAMEALMARG
eukprot:jgi/Tetstr1/447771/TSEL_035102.t1